MRDFDPVLGGAVITVAVVAIKFATDSSWAEVSQLGVILMLSLLIGAVPRLEDRLERLEKENRELSARLSIDADRED